MNTIYYKASDTAVAVNYKVGSSSLALAVIKAHHPDLIDKLVNNTSYPEGKSVENTMWHAACPKIREVIQGVRLIPIRDPIEKFRSACSQSRVEDVDAHLTSLEEAGWVMKSDTDKELTGHTDSHFWPQYRFLLGDGTIKAYRFPEHLDNLAEDAGLETPLPEINEGELSNPPKPNLTDDQIARIQALYADDITLYESISEAGQLIDPITVPATQEQKARKLAQYDAYCKRVCESDIIVEGLGAFHTDASTIHDLNTLRRLILDPTGLPDGLVVDDKYQGYKTADRQIVSLGTAELDQIESAIIIRKAQLYSIGRSLVQTQLETATEETIDLVTW